MCGIAGIWGNGNIKNMTEILYHRGPDENGYFIHKNIRLGIRRLSVIDLQTGSQPIYNEDKSIVIVYNGEIFNYKELRVELTKLGHIFKTQTDTEVIIHAYEEYGYSCLDKFIGMFAFAIYDKNKKKLFLARDRFGEKPLYFYNKEGNFLFASEIKSILTQVEPEPNITPLFWSLEASFQENTLYKNIYSLLPAHYLIYDGKNVKVKKYWDFPKEPEKYKSKKYYVDKLRWLIEDAVRLRLRSDVPVGVLLSGGLDSSIIACIAKPEKVFSCYYPLGERFEEIEYAKLVAKRIKAEHIIITPTKDEFKENLQKIIWHLDEPISTASPFSEFMLAQAVAKTDVKVILGGQGADELFGGYVRYVLMLKNMEIAENPFFKNYYPLASYFWSPKIFEDAARRYFDMTKRSNFGGIELFEFIKGIFNGRKSLIDSMGISDFQITFPSLIAMNDKAAASAGLESRTPFLDHRIAELAYQIPPELKIKGCTTKYILREAVKGLIPEKVRTCMDKKGLVTPVYRWLNNGLSDWKESKSKRLSERNICMKRDKVNRGEFDRTDYTKLTLELWLENINNSMKYSTNKTPHIQLLNSQISSSKAIA
ncbi:MAG: asparagine synthase (glutamine-hydrolyzing) [Candidatus Aureabacteria bacterium]|nr:asparagine synthase (glutamine-hydrolyzing) [Candidatus Auribacterota bacterium]